MQPDQHDRSKPPDSNNQYRYLDLRDEMIQHEIPAPEKQ